MECPEALRDFMLSEFATCREIPQEISRYVSLHRRSPFVQQFADRCLQFILSYDNYNYDSHTNGEFAVLQRLADDGADIKIVFDVGANTGTWSLTAHDVFPDAAIHCFEIMPSTCEELRKNVDQKENIIVNEFGLLDKNGDVRVKHYPGHSELSSVINYPHSADHVVATARVAMGDLYAKEHSVDHIDFLKIDVEGSEHLVLNGFSETITGKRVDIIQFEYGLVNILTKFLLIDFYRFLIPKGYRIGRIYPNYVELRDYIPLRDETFLGPNYLAVRNDRADLIEILSHGS
jgi:FkbM family methyltransferase